MFVYNNSERVSGQCLYTLTVNECLVNVCIRYTVIQVSISII